MDVGTVLPEIGADDFARRFSLRAANLMWLLGAGASASAGIPTSGDMIWDFKQALYVSQKRTSPQTVADLTSQIIRSRLQAHIDSSGNLPVVDAPDELRLQDERLRQMFVESTRRFGLIVAGYSGRDSSVMDALEEALKQTGTFPAGLFWLHRGETPPLPRVHQLLTKASSLGIEAALIRVENFDETLRDLVRLRLALIR